MALHRLQVAVRFDTMANATTFRDLVVARSGMIAGLLMDELPRVVEEHGEISVLADVRIPVKGDRENLRQVLHDRLRPGVLRVPGVQAFYLQAHRCTHDEAVPSDCSTQELTEMSG